MQNARLARILSLTKPIAVAGALLLVGVAVANADTSVRQAGTIAWPEPDQSARPWTRWWWHGSAVDDANLTGLLEEYRDAGLGGVEITCIYGVKGNANPESRLSLRCVGRGRAACHGRGRAAWYGGRPAGRVGVADGRAPTVGREDANSKRPLRVDQVEARVVLQTVWPRHAAGGCGRWAVTASNSIYRVISMARQSIANSPSGDWTVYTLRVPLGRRSGQTARARRRRSEHQSVLQAVGAKFLTDFGDVLDRLPGIRAQFHDSFEYEGDWQPKFLEEFAARRGYRLEDHLPALAGDGPREQVERVKMRLSRNAGRSGARKPGRAVGRVGPRSTDNWRATSRTGRRPIGSISTRRATFPRPKALVVCTAPMPIGWCSSSLPRPPTWRDAGSSRPRSATWLDEHFNVTLAQVKQIVDRQIAGGGESRFLSRHGLLTRRRRVARLVVLRVDAAQPAESHLARPATR